MWLLILIFLYVQNGIAAAPLNYTATYIYTDSAGNTQNILYSVDETGIKILSKVPIDKNVNLKGAEEGTFISHIDIPMLGERFGENFAHHKGEAPYISNIISMVIKNNKGNLNKIDDAPYISNDPPTTPIVPAIINESTTVIPTEETTILPANILNNIGEIFGVQTTTAIFAGDYDDFETSTKRISDSTEPEISLITTANSVHGSEINSTKPGSVDYPENVTADNFIGTQGTPDGLNNHQNKVDCTSGCPPQGIINYGYPYPPPSYISIVTPLPTS